MRHRTTNVRALALAAAVTATGTSAAAATSHSNGAAGDRVTGSAVGGFPTPLSPDSDRLTVSAASDPGGQHPRGTVQADAGPIAPFHVAGPVTCLKISGNRASIKYRFTTAQGSAAAFKGGGVEVFIEDNGRPRNGQPVDRNAFNPPQPAGIFDTTARQCDDPNLGAYQSVRSGDYTMRGADAGNATRFERCSPRRLPTVRTAGPCATTNASGYYRPYSLTTPGRRRYTDLDLGWLALLRCLRKTGMPVADIKQFVDLTRADTDHTAERLALLEVDHRNIDRQIIQFRADQDYLHEKIQHYRQRLDGAARPKACDDPSACGSSTGHASASPRPFYAPLRAAARSAVRPRSRAVEMASM